jgi:hemoglobin
MKRDIKTRTDIELLVTTFYDEIKSDPVIGHIFMRVIDVNPEKYLHLMTDFWENTLFYTGSYVGNPIEAHRRLNKMFPLQDEHFRQWVKLFTSTIDKLFEGQKALLAKQRASGISDVIKTKILQR